MDVLVETHDEAEVERALGLGAEIVGINNRDLKTLKVDLATTERLAPLVPKDRLLVAESGIRNRADVERLGAHADAFLVGSSLMRAENPAQAARELAFGRVKVCGLTDAHDVALAAENGASYAGLVMVPNTPRAVNCAEADEIVKAASGIALVGVFRNEKVDEVAQLAHRLGFSVVQLHGQEDAGYIKALDRCFRSLRDLQPRAPSPATPPSRLGRPQPCSKRHRRPLGGTGIAFDWARVKGAPTWGRHPRRRPKHATRPRAAAVGA
jgi:indole-3-glycerol phosphate synthase/phosphoribosylanthranilate isomerase